MAVKFVLLFVATFAISAFAHPTIQENSGAASGSIRAARAASPTPYNQHYNNPYGGHQHHQHYDDIHCLPHYGHLDCHVDHHDVYGGNGGGFGYNGNSGYDGYGHGGYGGYGGHGHNHQHYHGPNPGIGGVYWEDY